MSLKTTPSLRIPHAILIAALLVGFAGIAGMIVSIWELTGTPGSSLPETRLDAPGSPAPSRPTPGVWRSLERAESAALASAGAGEVRGTEPPPILISDADAEDLNKQQVEELRKQLTDPAGDPDAQLTEERIARLENEGLMVW